MAAAALTVNDQLLQLSGDRQSQLTYRERRQPESVADLNRSIIDRLIAPLPLNADGWTFFLLLVLVSGMLPMDPDPGLTWDQNMDHSELVSLYSY